MRLDSLRSARDFSRVMAAPKARRDGLTLFVVPAPGRRQVRVGFSVPRSVGSAVARNRLRRRLRAIVRELPDRGGRDLVIRAAPEAAGKDFQSLKRDLTALWGKEA